MIEFNKAKTPSSSPIDSAPTFIEGAFYINTQQWAFAYLVFTKIYQTEKSKSVALLFNMALCHYYANEYIKAFSLVSQALQQQCIPQSYHAQSTILPDELMNLEINSSNYQLALLESYSYLHPDILKLRIRRLLVDVHLKLTNWQEIIRLSQFPDMAKCKNVQQALVIAYDNSKSI